MTHTQLVEQNKILMGKWRESFSVMDGDDGIGQLMSSENIKRLLRHLHKHNLSLYKQSF